MSLQPKTTAQSARASSKPRPLASARFHFSPSQHISGALDRMGARRPSRRVRPMLLHHRVQTGSHPLFS